MNRGALTIARVNLQNIKVAYVVAAITTVTLLIQTVIFMIIASNTGVPSNNSNVSVGCYALLVPLIAAIIIPTKSFRRIVNLGGKRSNFLQGSLITYVVLSAFASLINTIVFYTFDQFIRASGYFSEESFNGVINVFDTFGWDQNGAIIGFVQQFALVFLATVTIHSLLSIQDKWYGLAVDIIIAAIISVFTPIAVLRPILIGFFELIIFQPNALLQIIACILIAIILWVLNKPIFARKII